MIKRNFILLVICSVLVLAGCADDQYTMERNYWRAQKQATKIFDNPHASPPYELDRVVGILNDFAKKYPETNLSVDAKFTIARLYMTKEEHDKARAQLNKIIEEHGESEFISAEAMFFIGNSYQMQDKWSLALKQYEELKQKFPLTQRGFNIPLFVAQHYKITHQPDKMIAAFSRAAEYYISLAERNAHTSLAYNSYLLATSCYTEIKDWQNAINTLNTIIDKFRNKYNVESVFINMAFIYYNGLKDEVKAKRVLTQFITDYPKSRFVKAAKELLSKIDKQ